MSAPPLATLLRVFRHYGVYPLRLDMIGKR